MAASKISFSLFSCSCLSFTYGDNANWRISHPGRWVSRPRSHAAAWISSGEEDDGVAAKVRPYCRAGLWKLPVRLSHWIPPIKEALANPAFAGGPLFRTPSNGRAVILLRALFWTPDAVTGNGGVWPIANCGILDLAAVPCSQSCCTTFRRSSRGCGPTRKRTN